ncbi:MAG: hypothetical protein ACPLN0_06665 [Candidatus Hydrothermia bacterium]
MLEERVKTWGVVVVLSVLLFWGVGQAQKTHASAGTLIRNQASATYKIGDKTYTSTSNEVITKVLAVYDMDILIQGQDVSLASNPVAVQSAFPGNRVYFQYEIRNYANTGDTIEITQLVKDASSTMPDPSVVELYEDINANGMVDAGEILLGRWNPSGGAWQSVNQDLSGDNNPDIYVDENSSKYFVISYTVPSTATDGQIYVLGVSGQSHGDNTVTDPGTEGGNNFHKLTVTTDASLSANKTAVPFNVQSGDTISYTIQGSNIGGRPTYPDTLYYDNDEDGTSDAYYAGVILKDPIDTSKVYLIPSSISGSPSGNTLYFYDDDDDGTGYWHSNLPTDATKIDSIAYVFPTLDPGQQYTFTFKVGVKNNVTNGTLIYNKATLYFRKQTTGNPRDSVSSNTTIVRVSISGAEQYGVHIGYPNPDAAPGGDFTKDTAKVDTAKAGLCTLAPIKLHNTGNTYDNFTISYVLATHPEWISSVTFYQADGVTPLPGNTIYNVPADSIVTFYVKYCISDTVNTTNSDAIIKIVAISFSDVTKKDTTTIVIDSIIGLSVDIGNADHTSGNVNNTSADSTTIPGVYVLFPLDVLNTGETPDVYTISGNIPSGWSVVFYPDTNDDGQIDAGSVPITQVGPLDAGEEAHIIAKVYVPDYTPAGTYNATFKATSTRDTLTYDIITNTITVREICNIEISPDRNGTGFPGGIVTYQHWVINRGNLITDVVLSVTSQRGWTYVILDNNQNIINTLTNVQPGESAIIYLRAFIPSNAPIGQPDIARLTATATTGGCSKYVTDVTDVLAGALYLEKWIMLPNGTDSTYYSTGHPSGGFVTSPDTVIYYRVHFKNLSTDTVKKAIIYDPIPAWTEIIIETAGTPSGVTPSGQILYSYSRDGGVNWSEWSTSHNLPVGWSEQNVTNIRFGIDRNNDGDITDADFVLPNETGYIEFKVKIK